MSEEHGSLIKTPKQLIVTVFAVFFIPLIIILLLIIYDTSHTGSSALNLATSNALIQPIAKLDFKDSKYATGRRKRSIAKVWVKKGSGNIHVNGLKMNDYFKRPVHQIIVTRPLQITEVASNYDVRCSVKGGGLSGQAGALCYPVDDG